MHFYNHERRPSAIGMRSPIDYEHTLNGHRGSKLTVSTFRGNTTVRVDRHRRVHLENSPAAGRRSSEQSTNDRTHTTALESPASPVYVATPHQ
jgi:hypothetical protein